MKAQVYQTANGWSAKTRYGKCGYEAGSYLLQQDALDALASMVKSFTGQAVEFDEVEIVDAPVLPLSVLKRDSPKAPQGQRSIWELLK